VKACASEHGSMHKISSKAMGIVLFRMNLPPLFICLAMVNPFLSRFPFAIGGGLLTLIIPSFHPFPSFYFR
jgi:hypothetical protein